MDTTNIPHPEQPELPEEESRMLPKLEDLAALTGLFNPEHIIEEMLEYDRLEAIDEAEVRQMEQDEEAEEARES